MTESCSPRILLLTEQASGMRYGTGEVVRRILNHMPDASIRVACFGDSGGHSEFPFETKVFPVRHLHWRLKAGLWQYLYARLQARRIANEICLWCQEDKPELIWVFFPGTKGLMIAKYLEQDLERPVHMTIHDSFEIEREFQRHSYLYGIFHRDVAALLEKTASVDVISEALLEHVQAEFGIDFSNAMVFPPSTDVSRLLSDVTAPRWRDDVRKIGVCGNPRVEKPQWEAFVNVLSGLPFDFQIHAFGIVELMLQTHYPANVRLVELGYADNEDDIISYFQQNEISMCYLGLYRDDNRAFFGRTSLSSKLTTYVASGCPVCIDGPADSVAWHLVSSYDGGVLFNTDAEGQKRLLELLSNRDVWKKKSDGANRLCKTEFDLERNSDQLMELMTLASKSTLQLSDKVQL